MNKHYAIVIGTHAEYIKMFPVLREFERRNIDYTFISTGQHDLSELIKDCGTKAPDIVLDNKRGFAGDTGGAFMWALRTLPKMYSALGTVKPDIVLYHGDTMSTVIASVAAKLRGIDGCHVEAGLRSADIREPFPEEIARMIADSISTIAFVPSLSCAENTKGADTYVVGNTVYDSIVYNMRKGNPVTKDVYAIATIHRHENIKSRERMIKIVDILSYSPIPVRLYLHENTKKKLDEYGLLKPLLASENVVVMPTINYKDFLKVFSNAKFVFTDGGSMSEECAWFNVPCIILRMETERKELLERPDQFLTRLDVDATKLKINEFSKVTFKNLSNNYYHNISPSAAIVNILETYS